MLLLTLIIIDIMIIMYVLIIGFFSVFISNNFQVNAFANKTNKHSNSQIVNLINHYCFYKKISTKNNKLAAGNNYYTNNLQEMINSIKTLNDKIQKDNPDALITTEVLDIMATIPRHKFVPDEYIEYAYHDTPLKIGYNQTISQPYIVALMTSLLSLNKSSSVLEIGTGSGYQTAILSKLANKVYTIEIIPELQAKAKEVLLSNNYKNIKFACKNGNLGWKKYAPFDAIIVTAAATKESLPTFIAQLNIDGKLVIPLENECGEQILFLIHKTSNNVIITKRIIEVRFVPMV